MHLPLPNVIPVRLQSHERATEQNNMTTTDGPGIEPNIYSWNILVREGIEEKKSGKLNVIGKN